MTDVTLLPTIGGFNLFLITKLQKTGRLLHGDDDKCIKLMKGGKSIRFDIAIPMAKGMLCAMYFKPSSREGWCAS